MNYLGYLGILTSVFWVLLHGSQSWGCPAEHLGLPDTLGALGFAALEHSYLVHRSFSALFIEALQTYFWPWIICGMVTELIKHFPGLGICGQRFLKNNLWELKQNKASHLLNEIAWMLESPLRSLPKKRTGGVLNYGCQILWDPEI